MIGKISDPRGARVTGLIYYLFGPGRREEHTDPHLIAGWRHPAELEPPLRPDGGRDFRRLTGLLRQPHVVLGPRGFDRPVWHCAVRAAPQDKLLSDDEWAHIACDVMHRTGLAPRGQEDDAVRWVAVRHGEDHIHIVAILARQDGGKPRLSNERYRVREACRAAEERYGLRRTAPGDRTAARRPTRAENEKTGRRHWEEPPRVTLWEHAARTASDAAGQIRHLAATDPSAAADAAWAAADTLHAAASTLRSRLIRQAADSFDRAARAPYGRIPLPTPAGNSLRQTARLLSGAAFGNDPAGAQITLITRLAALVEAIAELRVTQRHAAQAAAARRAAEHLHAASTGKTPPVSNTRTRAHAAAERVRLDFPMPPGPLSPGATPPAGARRPAQPGPRPSHGPGPPSRRGRFR